jgi:hypoxanthine phosphoribosyltransferase
MNIIQLHDKFFKTFISSAQIADVTQQVAQQIQHDYKHKNPIFLGVLNGSFLFAADLVRQFEGDCEISFIKLASYEGTSSTGRVNELIGLSENISGRHVVIIEDIVDTGNTLAKIYDLLSVKQPASIAIATLLFKPNAYQKDFPIDYAALQVGNEFLAGYGLDYNGLGRNLKDIFIVQP